ncbi:MAG: hypothetical protein NTU88_05520 [Armatimonadetes bacterium]|nr:hypothetical protein [Armatimonadota bacterium]
MKNWRRSILVGTIAIAAVLTAGVITSVLAQGRPGGPGGPGGPPPMGPPIVMKVGAENAYVLMGCTLIKYNASLEQQGTLALGDPPAARSDNAGAPPPPPPPATAIIASSANGVPESVLDLLGDQIIRVDGASLKEAAKGTLPALDLPHPPAPQCLELRGGTLYVLRGPQIIAVNIKDGQIIGSATLPKPPSPNSGN